MDTPTTLSSGRPPEQTWVFVCPDCRADVTTTGNGYVCRLCNRTYPIIYGIPDFRLTSDSYLDLEAERAKALTLAARAKEVSFSELLDYYYSITSDVPAELAVVYKRSIINGPDNLAEIVDELAADRGSTILDVGCGAGSLLLPLAERNLTAMGMDIAMRWLVIGKKRLEEAGFDMPLVCADLLHHPLKAGTASHVACIDVVEHTRDMNTAVRNIRGLLRPGGQAWLTVSNRYTLAPHPSTRLWLIGFLPKKLAGRLCEARRGVNSLRYVHLTSPGRVTALLQAAGFDRVGVRPRRFAESPRSKHPPLERALLGIYRRLSRWSWGRWVLVRIGPVAEFRAGVSGPVAA